MLLIPLIERKLGRNVFATSSINPSASQRYFTTFIRNVLGIDSPPSPDAPTYENRFHPWESSPCADLRTRAATIKAHAKCPMTSKDIQFTCPISGIPTHHSKEAWELDAEYRNSDRPQLLKQVNVYEHDLRSGRSFPELNFPGPQDFDRAVNFSNWDTFLYTRSFPSTDTDFQSAAVTKMLSYPITIGSILHQYSPYTYKKGRITLEGLKSLAALRYSLYPRNALTSSLKDRPLRVFIIGARTESRLPPHVWKQMCYLFPGTSIDIHFIGPECFYNQEKNTVETSSHVINKRVDAELGMFYHTEYFHVYHNYQDFFPYDPYLDVFFVFHPGFAASESSNISWKETVHALLETKCGVFVTGYNEKDSTSDLQWAKKNFADEMDVIFEEGENLFGSTKWELNDLDPQEVYQHNQRIFGIRGKRYHITN